MQLCSRCRSRRRRSSGSASLPGAASAGAGAELELLGRLRLLALVGLAGRGDSGAGVLLQRVHRLREMGGRAHGGRSSESQRAAGGGGVAAKGAWLLCQAASYPRPTPPARCRAPAARPSPGRIQRAGTPAAGACRCGGGVKGSRVCGARQTDGGHTAGQQARQGRRSGQAGGHHACLAAGAIL